MLSGNFTVIAGGNRAAIRDEARLLAEYGGQPGTWQKITSSMYTAADSVKFETHAYRNAVTGQIVELKTKLVGYTPQVPTR